MRAHTELRDGVRVSVSAAQLLDPAGTGVVGMVELLRALRQAGIGNHMREVDVQQCASRFVVNIRNEVNYVYMFDTHGEDDEEEDEWGDVDGGYDEEGEAEQYGKYGGGGGGAGTSGNSSSSSSSSHQVAWGASSTGGGGGGNASLGGMLDDSGLAAGLGAMQAAA